MIIATDLIDGGGIVRGQNIQSMRRIVQHSRSRVGHGDGVLPAKFRRVQGVRLVRRIDHDADFVRLENTIGRALGIVTAAIVVEHRNIFSRAFAKAHADLQPMRVLVVVALQRFDFRKARNVDALFFGDDDVMAAAIDRRSGLHADKAVAASFVGMRLDFQTADDAPAVQQLLVVAQLFHVETGFIGEIPLDQELAGEIIVAREWPVIAGRASKLGTVPLCE